ncbi:MAG: hypothetical protein PHC50_04700 [Candidatus Cloacimonetes bacterium]|nr:hypothetical protein [Candidatus Cloacimonadota bacterium]
MKRTFLIIGSLVLLSALALFFSACGGEDNDTLTGIPDIVPGKYDWQIMIVDAGQYMEKATYGINCYWLGSASAITDDDEFSIKFDGVVYELENFNLGIIRMIFGSANLNPGTTYNVAFYKNDKLISSGSLNTPYRAQGSFPTSYDPHQQAKVSWTLDADNQYQSISLSSDGEGYEDEDEYTKNLDPAIRSYSFPANAVKSFGPDTRYVMGVVQYSFLKSGKSAFLAVHTNAQHYGEEQPTKMDKNLELKKLADRLCARH